MKKNLFKIIMMAGALTGVCMSAQAQIKAPTFADNWALNHVDARFAVTAPAGIAGVKAFTISNDGSGLSSEWGGAVTTSYINVAVAKAYDSLGATDPLVNGSGSYPSLTGKFALIFRGGSVEFSKKAKLCQDKGAIGCIIVNNIPGDPVGMGAGTNSASVTIPVIMVSDVVGAAMNSQLLANQSVTISLSRWGFNYAHDLGILPDGIALPPNYAMPASQLGASNGNPVQYKGQTGVYIGNFGTSASESNVKVVSNVTWTPTNGNASSYHKDSVSFSTFNRADSILVGYVPESYDLHATTTGKFDFSYKLSMAANDSSNTDNTGAAVMYVTDSIFCKSRYDFAKGTPVSVLATAPSGTNFVWGPLFHTTTAGYAMKAAQLTVAISGSSTLGGVAAPVNVLVYKWNDINTPTSIMTGDELTLVGYGSYTFTGSDSSFKFVDVNLLNVDNPSLLARTEANATYWVAAEVPQGTLLGVDGLLQYVPRTFVRSRANSSPSVIDLYAPEFEGGQSDLDANGPLVRPIFIEGYSSTNNFPDSVRYSKQRSGYTPAISLKLSKGIPTSVNSNAKLAFNTVSLFPNPATNVLNYTVKLEDKTSKLYVTIVDGVGRFVSRDIKNDVKDGTFAADISKLSAGQYYMILNADQGTVVKKFTVLAK